MTFSVIIPVKDDPPIIRCVESVFASAVPGQLAEVIVVDNGSEPAFRSSLDGLGPCVTILDEPSPGAGAARNAAIARARGDVLLFTDADCVVEPGWPSAALEGLDATGAGILRGSAGGIASTPGARLIESSFAPRSHWKPGQRVAADTKNMAVRREVFEQVRFNPGSWRGEDSEFGRHAEAQGLRIAYWPAMRVGHEHEALLETFVAKRIAGGWVAERTSDDLARLYATPSRRRRLARSAAALPGSGRPTVARALVRAAIREATALTALEGRLPPPVGGRLASLLGAWAFGIGGFIYRSNLPQPRFRELLDSSYFRQPA